MIQMAVGASKPENIAKAVKFITEASSAGANIVTLPECFNSPYGTKFFHEYAEPIPGPSTQALSKAAKENSVYVVGGSIPEKDGDKIYNTCAIYSPSGELIAKHRKVHLFDIDVPGKITFKESEILSPGNQFTIFKTPFCTVGVGICYDIRFAEMAQIYANKGCQLLVYPGAFNMTTGPAHWELLQRGRAIDNQVYVGTASPARDTGAGYVAWGHSCVVNPWGDVISATDEKESVVYADIEDDNYAAIRRHFLMQGKGRRPDLPVVHALTNRLLIQLYFLKEEANTSYAQLKLWLNKLLPNTETVSEGRIHHRIQSLIAKADETTDVGALLCEEYDFNELSHVLSSLGLTRLNIDDPDGYPKSPEIISNEIVIELSKFMSKESRPQTLLRKWLLRLSVACQHLTDSKLKTQISKTMEKYSKLSKKKKSDLFENFLKSPFLSESNDNVNTESVLCNKCSLKDNVILQQNQLLKSLELDKSMLVACKEEMEKDIAVKIDVIKELQLENQNLSCKLQNIKSDVEELSMLKKKVRTLESQLDEISNTKLYYQRNYDLKILNKEKQRRVTELEKQLEENKITHDEVKKKVKKEQDLKHKYKKAVTTLTEEKEACLHALSLNEEKAEENLTLKQKENKCTMYSDQVRLLYMSLQGEANVAASQASKVVKLVAKHLFNKDIPLRDLPCPRTCLNFMNEANHIGKQQIVSVIRDSDHFTYATDGTSREKKHYMEHHIVLASGSTLSVGFSEVANDKADTLLEKSLDLFEEIADVYCQAEDENERIDVYTDILVKMKALMSDRAANMKLFDKKMLQYKKDIVGEDATIHFLFCNAHFLIGLADQTDKAMKMEENLLEERTGTKLGRANHGAFRQWSVEETSTSRLIRTASDVLGPRGDEKNGCREEWLAYCDRFEKKSTLTSYRSNRFNNMFENAVALLLHRADALHFLQDCVSHSNLKLLSICCDLEDKRIMSLIAAIALLSTYLTTPYWTMMNSQTAYGKFPAHVQSMTAALERWSSSEFDIFNLHMEEPVFGQNFHVTSEVAFLFISSEDCDKVITTTAFKTICSESLKVVHRQLSDFLPGGIYGGCLPHDVQELLDKCPLTNLTGERLFGDLDYDMSRRRTATTLLRSTLSMWKHNTPSKFLNKKAPTAFKKSMAAGRKHGKELKRKHDEAVKVVRERIKTRIAENEEKRRIKENQDKERQSQLLTELLSQGGLISTKEDLDKLKHGPNALQNLKVQIRFRKYYMNAKQLRLTGNFNTLYNSLCTHLGIDSDEESEPPRKKRKTALTEADVEHDSDEEEEEDANDSEGVKSED